MGKWLHGLCWEYWWHLTVSWLRLWPGTQAHLDPTLPDTLPPMGFPKMLFTKNNSRWNSERIMWLTATQLFLMSWCENCAGGLGITHLANPHICPHIAGPRMQNDHPGPVHLSLSFVFPLGQLHSLWGSLLGKPAYSGVHPNCLATTEESVLSPPIQWVSGDNSDLVWFGSHTHSQIYLWTRIGNTLVSPHQEVSQATLRVTWIGSGERTVP